MLSAGLVEKIDKYQTLSLKGFTATDLDPFLSIYDDYFYHTQTPRRPEVSLTVFPRCIVSRCPGFFQFASSFAQVGDVRVRFSFAGLSSEASALGPAQTVSSHIDDLFLYCLVSNKCWS